ncbi:TPA: hypothetical protein HA361_02055 [Candidatus Woesearchaeota archaeon]|nr:hypothetical protein [Candidatus Woesearchaeota archaeon]HII68723.1 hypothetical protein [Candidatus Woesearchaeota archaeon]
MSQFAKILAKKSLHILVLFLLIPFGMLEAWHGKQAGILFLVGVLIVFLVLEYFRLELDWKVPLFQQLMSQRERENIYSVVYFLAGAIICVAAFDTSIAVASLLMTILGELTASIVGLKYGTTLFIKNKTVVGTTSELVVNLLIGFVVLSSVYQFYVIIAMAFVATFIEVIIDELDEHLLGPIFSGFVGQLLILL